RLELTGSLETGSTVGGFIGHLAGADGEEAIRRHARVLAQRLVSTSIDGERVAVSRESIAELAAALPRAGALIGTYSPVTYGMYTYLNPGDPAMTALAAELRSNWESSADPILRMRSARVLAETGDSRAGAFLRESVASFDPDYSGGLSIDERLSRAAGLAVDGNEAAARFLQNVAMNPRETVTRRTRALEYLPPQSLDNGSDTAEVFRSLVEDPEEPVATRYLMMSVLARAPHPPEVSWWQQRIDDPTMTVSDRASSSGTTGPGNSSTEFSQWNLAIAALGTCHAEFAAGLLNQVIQNRGAPVPLRREALMALLHHEGRAHLSWEALRGVLALPDGHWDGILEEVASGERPLRLRIPRERSAITEAGLGSSETVDSEIVIEVRHSGDRWEADLRPLSRAQDSYVRPSDPPPYESYLPLNRRIALGGISTEEIGAEVLLPVPDYAVGATDPAEGAAAPTGSSGMRENTQLSSMGMGI
ncbi:MAG TPA: hypothetical protein VJP40_07240, partial [bacterium]|nr:hypothetical protein [bacterium]